MIPRLACVLQSAFLSPSRVSLITRRRMAGSASRMPDVSAFSTFLPGLFDSFASFFAFWDCIACASKRGPNEDPRKMNETKTSSSRAQRRYYYFTTLSTRMCALGAVRSERTLSPTEFSKMGGVLYLVWCLIFNERLKFSKRYLFSCLLFIFNVKWKRYRNGKWL